MANKFESLLETIGKGFMKGLNWAVTYAIPVEKLIALIFPAAAPAAVATGTALSLIQTTVMEVEQKYAASGIQSGTGAQKAAEVLTITGPAVIALLAKEGITADSTYVQSLIDAVVGILNVWVLSAPATGAPTTGAAV